MKFNYSKLREEHTVKPKQQMVREENANLKLLETLRESKERSRFRATQKNFSFSFHWFVLTCLSCVRNVFMSPPLCYCLLFWKTSYFLMRFYFIWRVFSNLRTFCLISLAIIITFQGYQILILLLTNSPNY